MTTIYLIRHGAYENPKKILHLRLPGFPLSREGMIQVSNLAKHLHDNKITAAYSSRLIRAYQTAEILAKDHGIPVITNRKLLDIRSPLQGKPIVYINSLSSDFYNPKYIKAGGERLSQVFSRMDQCLRAIAKKHRGESVVVVSHGDPIMTIWYAYQGKPLPRFFPFNDWYVPMATGFKIEFDAAVKPVRISKFPA